MVLYNQGINKIRDEIAAVLDKGQLGRDGSEVVVNGTTIIDPITGTDKTLTVTTINKGIVSEYQTTAGDGSGNSAREWVITHDDTTVMSRVAFPEITLQATTVVNVKSQYLFIQEL